MSDIWVSTWMNGIECAYPWELDYASIAIRKSFGAHTSGSIVVYNDNGTVLCHILIDAGIGTISSLAKNRRLYPKRVDAIFLTHLDQDHHPELPLLCEILKRLKVRKLAGLERQPIPVPVYCSQKRLNRLMDIYSFDAWTPDKPDRPIEFKSITVGSPTEIPILGRQRKSFKVTSFYQDPLHRDSTPFVVEFGKERQKRVVFAWDMAQLPFDPEKETVPDILKNPALLYVEANTLLPRSTGHVCAQDAAKFAKALDPDEAYVVHYSGFEDKHPGEKDKGEVKEEDIFSWDELDRKLATLHVKLRVARPREIYPANQPGNRWIWE